MTPWDEHRQIYIRQESWRLCTELAALSRTVPCTDEFRELHRKLCEVSNYLRRVSDGEKVFTADAWEVAKRKVETGLCDVLAVLAQGDA